MNQYNTMEHGIIEVSNKEAYFRRDDLIAKVNLDDLGYLNFAHPLWLTRFRVYAGKLYVEQWVDVPLSE
jgi:hypothetical protein